jgi:hypothetical protein
MKITQQLIGISIHLPDQLEIRNGKLVAIDGTKPDFSAFPDGPYNLSPREALEKDLMLSAYGAFAIAKTQLKGK